MKSTNKKPNKTTQRVKNSKYHPDIRLRPPAKPVWESPRPVREGGPGGKYPPPAATRNETGLEAMESKIRSEHELQANVAASTKNSITFLQSQVQQANEMTERYARALNDLNASFHAAKSEEGDLRRKLKAQEATVKKLR